MPVQGVDEAMSRACLGAKEGRVTVAWAEAWRDLKSVFAMRASSSRLRSEEMRFSWAIFEA